MLHSTYVSALGEELAQSNPLVGIRRPKVQRRRWRILDPAEVARVLKAFDDERARLIFLALVMTGLRRHELQQLRWRDVSLTEATLRVVSSKTEEGERLIALASGLVTAPQRTTPRPPTGQTTTRVAHPQRGSKLDSMWYADEFSKALAEAGITDHVRPFHDLRHAALTNLAAAGVSPTAIMGTAGHKSFSTTLQYVHLAGVVFRDEAQALDRRLLGVQDSGTNPPKSLC